MITGPTTPGGRGWDFQFLGNVGIVGGGIAGIYTIATQHSGMHHKKIMPLHKQQIALQTGQINPRQFLVEQVCDKYRLKDIERHLTE